MEQAGKKSVVVFVSGKPVSEPWIQEHAGAVLQQFYPGELVRNLSYISSVNCQSYWSGIGWHGYRGDPLWCG